MKSSKEQDPKKIENENKRKQLRKRRQTANKKVKEVFYSHFFESFISCIILLGHTFFSMECIH